MPKLRIYKTQSFFAGPKDVILLIDDKEVGHLKHEKKMETDLSFGLHSIQVKSKFFSSTVHEFKMDVKKEIEVSVRYSNFFKITQIVFISAVSVSIFFESKIFFIISDILLVAFLLIILVKRKDFFSIKELN